MLDPERAPRVLFRLTCRNGHPWVAYGPDEGTHWGPTQCVKCASPWLGAEKIADLTDSPKHRYRVRLQGPEDVPAQEQEIWADRYTREEGAVVFLTGPHDVARFRRLAGNPVVVA